MTTSTMNELKEPVLRNLDPSNQQVGGYSLLWYTNNVTSVSAKESDGKLHIGFYKTHEFVTSWRRQKGETEGATFLLVSEVTIGDVSLHKSEDLVYIPGAAEMKGSSNRNVILGIVNPQFEYKIDLKHKASIKNSNSIKVSFSIGGSVVSELECPITIAWLDEGIPKEVRSS